VLSNILLGLAVMIVNLGILVVAIAMLLRFVTRRLEAETVLPGIMSDVTALAAMLGILMLGQAFMFTSWALLFIWLGEFSDFATAFYHSAVNFTSLGYGDIVMSEEHRLLGALEAANGVMMLGLATGAILAVMNGLFSRRGHMSDLRKKIMQDN
jgi:hypothetical protein